MGKEDAVDDTRRDQMFKSLMLDIRVLSRIIGIFVSELRGIDPEEIVRMRERGDIIPIGTEMVSKRPMMADVVYRIRLPNGDIVYLDIEGQLYRNPGDVDLNRAMMYAVKMLDDERSSPDWKGYGSVRKVYSAWVLLDPHADERNSVVSYSISGRVKTLLHKPVPSGSDLLEVVMVGIGDPKDAESPESEALDLLFWKGIWDDERELTLRKVFKLSAEDDIILLDGRGICMSLDEEFREHWTGVGYNLGLADGETKGEVRGEAKARIRMIDAYVVSVRRVMDDMGASLESAMSIVPSDIADEVRARLES